MVKEFRNSGLACVGLILALAGGGACSLDIAAPSLVAGDQLDFPFNAGLIMTSVQADFECALAHYTITTGLFGNELLIGNILASIKEIDRRDVNPGNSLYTSITCSSAVEGTPGLYKPLATARFDADHAATLLEGWTDAQVSGRQAMLASAYAYAGYAVLLMGEGMCSSALDIGPELTPTQLFQEAEKRFTKGIAAAQASANSDLNVNLVGRARTRLRLGNTAGASADAAQVPLTYVKNATYSADAARRENLVWVQGQRSRIFTIDPSYRGLTFGGVADPRVPVVNANALASDGQSPLWITTKYASNAAPIPIATGGEAQLIVAEVAGGQTAVNIINALHARAGLPAFASTDPTAIQNQIIEERKRELFLDGHHLGDLRQYKIPLAPAAGTQLIGNGGLYMSQTCFTLPDVERLNNPNITKP